MNIPKVFLIILDWNGLKDTCECLESVKKIDYPNYEVIVVDNGSTDGSCQVIPQRFPWVKLICNQRNEGFARGNNIGIGYALNQNADFILLLNNDTVVDPQILSHFIQAAKKYPQAKIFGPKIYCYQEPNKIWCIGARWDEDKMDFHIIGYGVVDDGFTLNEVEEVDIVIGAAIFFDTKIINKIGFFDERFFVMHEETDWCFRARKAGYHCLFIPQAKIWHKVGASYGGQNSPLYLYFYWRNCLLWAERYLNLRQRLYLWLHALNTFQRHLRLYFGITPHVWLRRQRVSKKQRILGKAVVQGILDYILRRFYEGPRWISTK
jgi:hypothetical protein